MRKKDIKGYAGKNPGLKCSHTIIKIPGDAEAYAALITFLPGTKEMRVVCDGRELNLISAGYKWLVYFPMDKSWALTAFYDDKGVLFEWYFDISRGNFVDERGMPCIDDIFLDLVVFPDERVLTLDADELQDALDNGEIAIDDFNHAYKIHDQLMDSEWVDVGFLTRLCDKLLLEIDTATALEFLG